MTTRFFYLSQDLLQPLSFSNTKGEHMIPAAAIAHQMMAYMEWTSTVGQGISNREEESRIDRIGTGCDRWFSGALIVALAAARSMIRVLDIEKWQESDSGGGVFTYDWCEAHYDGEGAGNPALADNLPAYLLSYITDRAWYDISENWMEPTDEAMDKLITHWAHSVRFPVIKKLPELVPATLANLSVFMLPRGWTSDSSIEVPIKTIEQGVKIVAAMGLQNLDDAFISQYHVELVLADNPNQEHMNWLEIQRAVWALEEPKVG